MGKQMLNLVTSPQILKFGVKLKQCIIYLPHSYVHSDILHVVKVMFH